MLALLTFNKRLGWVVAACVGWSMIGLLVAVGHAARGQGDPGAPFRLSMGLAQDSIIVDGQVLSVIEDELGLSITVRSRPDGRQQAYKPGGEIITELPANLTIEFTTSHDRHFGPPEVELLSGSKQAKEVARGRFGLVTEHYAIKFAQGHLRIMPKPADAKPGWWRRFIQKEPREQGKPPRGEDGMREDRPGNQQRPGDGQRQQRPGDRERPSERQRPGRNGDGGSGKPPPKDGKGGSPRERPPGR